MALPGATVALSINRRFWALGGFDRAVDALVAAGRISTPALIEVEIYGAAAVAIDFDHAGDRALIATFRVA